MSELNSSSSSIAASCLAATVVQIRYNYISHYTLSMLLTNTVLVKGADVYIINMYSK